MIQTILYQSSTSFLIKLLTLLSIFFIPIIPAMIAVGILVIIDFITGLIAAKKQNVAITSKKMGATITKMLVYQLIIITSQLCETYLVPQIPFIKITLAFLAVTEFTSIAENFQKTTGKDLMSKIRAYLDKKFRGLIKDDNEKK